MTRAAGTHPRIPRRAGRLALLAAAVALAGCDTVRTGADGMSGARSAAAGARFVERDVEMPEVFQMEEPGLWDGRPSLGGIWVAHPAATDPERVIIRNVETGTSIAGALFRRERDHPGPRFQISSEAANALGILAGRPTPIRVTAVRLQQVEIAPPAPEIEEAEPEAAAAPDAAPAATPDATPERPRGLRALFQRRPPPAEEPAEEPEADEAVEDGAEDAAEPATRAATARLH